MQLQTTSPESKFPNEYSDVIFIQIDQHLKKLLQKYKGVPILWIIIETYCLGEIFCPILSSTPITSLFSRTGPPHRARETVELLKVKTPDFIPANLWPPNSPDLNPVDYKMWGVLQERVYKTSIKDVDELTPDCWGMGQAGPAHNW